MTTDEIIRELRRRSDGPGPDFASEIGSAVLNAAADKIERLAELLRLALACEDEEGGWRERARQELSS